MPAFRYDAVDAAGQARRGVLEGDTARAVRAQLRAQALVPLEVRPVGEGGGGGAQGEAGAAQGASRWGRRVFDAAMLAPERNERTVLTLSHEQVRRPINRGSIGRWKNYEWMFREGWEGLAAVHAARIAGK